MKTALLVPFRLGSAISETVPSQWLDLYLYVAKTFMDEECSLAQPTLQSTIPIDNEKMANHPAIIYYLMQEHIQPLLSQVDVVVVDATSPQDVVKRGTLFLHLARAIAAAFGPQTFPKKALTGPLFVVLLPTLPVENDDFRKLLSPLLDEGKVILVADNGHHIPDNYSDLHAFAEQYRLRIVEARQNSFELLAKKLIRRLGHFKRPLQSSHHHHCVRYFYDGTLCQEEIADLLTKHLEKIGASSSLLLLYHCRPNSWLISAILSVATDLGIDLHKAEDWIMTAPLPPSNASALKPLLIVDMVDSGDTLSQVVKALFSKGLSTDIDILTVLTTKSTQTETRERKITIGGKDFSVRYLIKVEQSELDLKQCEMCSLKLPFSGDDLSSETFMLSTYDMWEMANEAGIGPERDVPPYRGPAHIVPNYPAMIEKHGAWLAFKMHKRLESRPEGIKPDTVVICPDEKGSVVYSEYLRFVLGFQIIRIPRDVIDIFKNGGDQLALLKRASENTHPDWFNRVASITDAEVIIVDEFNRSGGTFEGIKGLLNYFRKQPSCYFPLIDMNPEWSSQCDVPTFSLYDWQSTPLIAF